MVILLFLTLFLRQSFSPELGTLYTLMALVSLVIYLADSIFGKVDIPLEKLADNRGEALLVALIGYLITLVVSYVIVGTTALIGNALQAEVLPFKGDVWVQVFAFSVVVATIESITFFMILYEFLLEAFSVFFGKTLHYDVIDGANLFVMVIVASIFTIFHIQTKTVSTSMMITFAFAMISMLMISQQREGKSAILLHVINNLVAILIQLGIWKVFG